VILTLGRLVGPGCRETPPKKNLLEAAPARKNASSVFNRDSKKTPDELNEDEIADIFRGAAEKVLVNAGGPSNFFGHDNIAGRWNPVHLVDLEGHNKNHLVDVVVGQTE
jgi:hypothetical protein